MQGIPDVKDTDAEDVVWGLQTAASLWKRGERIDAIVWLRRAAQAAGEANDDDRALELARYAAELSDWMATLPPGSMSEIPPSLPTARPGTLPPNAQPTYAPFAPVEAPTFVPGRDDGLPAESEPRSIEVLVPVEVESSPHPVFPPPSPSSKRPARPQPPPSRPPSQPTMQTPEPTFEREPHPSQPDEEHSASVPPADKVHAGMFNPWDEAATAPPEAPPEPPTPPPRPRSPSKAPAHARSDEEGVVTSIRPQAPSKPAAPLAPPRPPPLPPRAKAPKPPLPRSSSPSETRVQAAPSAPPPVEDVPPSPTTDEDVETSASHHEREPQPPPMTPVPPSPTQQMDLEERERLRRASLPPGEHDRRITRSDEDDAAPRDDGDPNGGPGVAMPDFSAPPPPLVESHVPPAQLDLEGVESFADLPDDARAAFAAAATLSELREAEEV
ncbi:MAG TPA: hypothetical protein VIF62_39155, partial [Labilithrix sp.]